MGFPKIGGAVASMANSPRLDQGRSLSRGADQNRAPAHEIRDAFPIAYAVLQGKEQRLRMATFENTCDCNFNAVSFDCHHDQVRSFFKGVSVIVGRKQKARCAPIQLLNSKAALPNSLDMPTVSGQQGDLGCSL